MISVRNLLLRLNGSNVIKPVVFLCLLSFFAACSVRKQPDKKPPVQADSKENEAKRRREDSLAQNKIRQQQLYTVSLILPFQLDKLDLANLNSEKSFSKASIALDFYLGARLAADSLAKQGMNIRLQVYDSEYDSIKIRRITQKPELSASDLIIGPVYPEELGPVSSFSKSKQILTVFPLSPAPVSSYRNPYFLMANSSLEAHAEEMASFISGNLKPEKVIILRSNSAKENKFTAPFRKSLDSLAKTLPRTEVNVSKSGKEEIKKYLSAGKKYVIVIPSTDPAFLVSLLTYLGALTEKYQITVFGHPSWEDIDILDVALLEKLNVHFTSSFYLDFKDAKTVKLFNSYRDRYAAEPSEFSVKGFDQMYYFGKLMHQNGKNYQKAISGSTYKTNYTVFDFFPFKNTGYKNRYLSVLRFDNFRLIKVK